MKTSAPSLMPNPLIGFTGTLLANARACVRPADSEGHMVPVLCMEIEPDGTPGNQVHSEQQFQPGQQAQCEAAATRFRRGMRVQVDHPTTGLRVVLPHTQHIHVLNPGETSQ